MTALVRLVACWVAPLTPLALVGCQVSPADEARALAARVRPPDGWIPSRAAPSVPGDQLAAWSGPDGASLVLYRTLGVPKPRPESLARELANRLTNLPGARVHRAEVVDGPSGRVARVQAVAPGDGSRLAPSGLGKPVLEPGPIVPTCQISVGRPETHRTLWLVAHYPEASQDRIGPALEQTLRSWDPGPMASGSSAAY